MKRAPTGNSNTLTSSPSLQPFGGLHYMTQARSSVMRCYSGSPQGRCRSARLFERCCLPYLQRVCSLPVWHRVCWWRYTELHARVRNSMCQCAASVNNFAAGYHTFSTLLLRKTPAEEAAEGGDWVSPHQWWVEGIIPEWPWISLIMKKSAVQTQKASRVLSH